MNVSVVLSLTYTFGQSRTFSSRDQEEEEEDEEEGRVEHLFPFRVGNELISVEMCQE